MYRQDLLKILSLIVHKFDLVNYFFSLKQINLSGFADHIKTSLQQLLRSNSLYKNTMPAKYIWSANGTRVLLEDHQETQSSPEKCVYPSNNACPLSRPSPNKRILSPQQQQALLKKAAQLKK